MITAITTAMPSIELGPAAAGLTAMALVFLLTLREIAAAAAGGRSHNIARSLLVSILPLLIVFAIIVSSRLLRIP